MTSSINEANILSIPYHHQFVTLKLSKHLRTIIPRFESSYVIACIGSDRSTGDSLGPLTGSLLQKRPLKKLDVYGTLHQPLHALNLNEQLESIHRQHSNPYIIAIDASLGSSCSIGTIFCGPGPIKPGSALQKELPELGHVHIAATVNLNSQMNHLILQHTRLSLVYDMASIIAQACYRLDLYLRNDLTFQATDRFDLVKK